MVNPLLEAREAQSSEVTQGVLAVWRVSVAGGSIGAT